MLGVIFSMELIQEQEIARYIEQTQNFVLWHYQFGSKYDTPFWDYAKTLTFEDKEFDNFLNILDNLISMIFTQKAIFMVEWQKDYCIHNGLHIVLSDGMMG